MVCGSIELIKLELRLRVVPRSPVVDFVPLECRFLTRWEGARRLFGLGRCSQTQNLRRPPVSLWRALESIRFVRYIESAMGMTSGIAAYAALAAPSRETRLISALLM